mmetsp:Transcript_27775/g.70804  ORF Transcript_27775/g.70804 Transcript_27775/m.70804 type:complete len:344 (-) Transcript_27775:758-1789(-)
MGTGPSKLDNDHPEYTVELTFSCALPVENVIATAEEAGKAILSIYNSEVSKWEVELKSDSSPLTRADKEANRIICDDLMALAPHIPIVSEENKLLPYDVRKKFQYYWLVDPLDGTKEFLKRNGEFTVNIALISQGEPVLGVVHVPCQAKTYWAVKGKGAYVRTGKSQNRISAAEFSLDEPGLRLVASSSHLSHETEEFISLFTSPEFMQVGSSLKLLMVAEGAAHIYPRLAPTCEWDTAAADVIVREAGGVVLQAGLCDDKGRALEDWKKVLVKEAPVTYNKEDMLNPFFIVFGRRRGLKPPGKGRLDVEEEEIESEEEVPAAGAKQGSGGGRGSAAPTKGGR